MINEIEKEIATVLSHYGIGRLSGFERNERGYVNTNFAIQAEMDGVHRKYFLRRYKPEISVTDIEFEHSIIQHLYAKGFNLVASVIPALGGQTFIRNKSSEQSNPAYYAIFEFRSGEDRYTCVDPHCSKEEVSAAAVVLAQFHQAVSDLQPRGHKSEPGIYDLLASLPGLLESSLRLGKVPKIERYLVDNAAQIRAHIKHTITGLENSGCQDCPQIVIHCDYHPGNLQFKGSQVSALFDFDWSKIDLRIFDVALALFYFFASWGADHDGDFRVGEMQYFLESYQAAFSNPGAIGPLTATELRCLPVMIQAGNLYVLNWALQDYCNKTIDPQEYMIWIKHGLNTMYWLEQDTNQENLGKLVLKLMKEIDG